MSRRPLGLAVAAIVVASPSLRALCYDSCVADPVETMSTAPAAPSCHEPSDAEPHPRPEPTPTEDGCRHGDNSPAPRVVATSKAPTWLAAAHDAAPAPGHRHELAHQIVDAESGITAPPPAPPPLAGFVSPLRL